jgi:hypothetical protein
MDLPYHRVPSRALPRFSCRFLRDAVRRSTNGHLTVEKRRACARVLRYYYWRLRHGCLIMDDCTTLLHLFFSLGFVARVEWGNNVSRAGGEGWHCTHISMGELCLTLPDNYCEHVWDFQDFTRRQSRWTKCGRYVLYRSGMFLLCPRWCLTSTLQWVPASDGLRSVIYCTPYVWHSSSIRVDFRNWGMTSKRRVWTDNERTARTVSSRLVANHHGDIPTRGEMGGVCAGLGWRAWDLALTSEMRQRCGICGK